MKVRCISKIGFIGSSLMLLVLIFSSIISDLNPIKNLISETYARETEYGKYIRFLGLIPSGLLLATFFYGIKAMLYQTVFFKSANIGLSISYGILTVFVGLFPCDTGCPTDFSNVSLSQMIHTLAGLITYVVVPICIFIIGLVLKMNNSISSFKTHSLIISGISSVLIIAMLTIPRFEFKGLVQRVIEFLFIFWTIRYIYLIQLKEKTTGNNGYT